MKPRRVSAYEVDGKMFGSKREAEIYLEVQALERILESLPPDIMSRDVLRDWMIEQGWPLINVLSAIARRGPRNTPEESMK